VNGILFCARREMGNAMAYFNAFYGILPGVMKAGVKYIIYDGRS
jgi:hypothetical protein